MDVQELNGETLFSHRKTFPLLPDNVIVPELLLIQTVSVPDVFPAIVIESTVIRAFPELAVPHTPETPVEITALNLVFSVNEPDV